MLYVSGHLRRSLSAAVATVAILGTGQVAAAQAAPTFSAPNTPLASAVVGTAPTISLTRPGFASVTLTCPTLKPSPGFTLNNGSPAQGNWYGGTMSQSTCTGSNGATYGVSVGAANPLILNVAGSGFAVTSTQSTFSLNGGPVPGGQGVATAPSYAMTWTNGSGATPSTVSLNNHLLGTTVSQYFYQNAWTARITGQWSLATSGGGLITALP